MQTIGRGLGSSDPVTQFRVIFAPWCSAECERLDREGQTTSSTLDASYEQPRALQRTSPSRYAWQVEVAAGKLVMAASKLICKELGVGARCQLRKAAANQITALRCVSEAVGVKSFERASTELRGGLGHDTSACRGAGSKSDREQHCRSPNNEWRR